MLNISMHFAVFYVVHIFSIVEYNFLHFLSAIQAEVFNFRTFIMLAKNMIYDIIKIYF